MSGAKGKQRRGYLEYVESGLATSDVELKEALAKRSLGIGDQTFRVMIERIRNKTALSHRVREDVSFRKTAEKIESSKILKIVGGQLSVPVEEFSRQRKGSYSRAIAARFLQKYGERTQREIAAMLGMSTGAAISIQLRRLREAESTDRQLAKQLAAIEKVLRNL